MNVRDLARRAGIAVCVATVAVLAAPYAVVSDHGSELAAYYTAGQFGGGGVVLFALLAAVVFASVDKGNVDPGTLAGVLVVLSVATPVAAALWYLSIDPNVLFSLPATYSWMEWHAPAVIAVSLPTPALAGLYAWDLLSG